MDAPRGSFQKSRIGWFSVGLGVFWQATGIAHHLEYLEKIVVERLDLSAIGAFVLGSPSIVLIVFGCGWVVYFNKRQRHDNVISKVVLPQVTATIPAVVAPVPEVVPHLLGGGATTLPIIPGDFDEMEMSERIVERRVVYRKHPTARS